MVPGNLLAPPSPSRSPSRSAPWSHSQGYLTLKCALIVVYVVPLNLPYTASIVSSRFIIMNLSLYELLGLTVDDLKFGMPMICLSRVGSYIYHIPLSTRHANFWREGVSSPSSPLSLTLSGR